MSEDKNGDILSRSVRRHRELRERENHGSFARDLAWIGALAWLIVGPLLFGVFVGRWLDRLWGSGIKATAVLIALSAFVGGYLAWRRLQQP
jgi:ATP synthase protein I